MFAKLLKHEWRSTRGVIGMLCVIILVCGLTIGGIANFLMPYAVASGDVIQVEETAIYVEEAGAAPQIPAFVGIVCAILFMTAFAAVAICCAASVFVVIWRFYKSRFSDEGYLTFTLPVNHHQLLLSSMLNSICGIVLVFLAAAAAVVLSCILLLMGFPMDFWPEAAAAVGRAFGTLMEAMEGNWGIFWEIAGTMLLSGLHQIVVLMLAVTIGAMIAKKYKLLAAVGAYYLIGLVQVIVQMAVMANSFLSENITWIFSGFNWIALLTILGGYWLMYYLTSRKLNLN